MLTAEQLREKLRGPVVAMTTHFKDDLSLDLDAQQRLTEYYVEQKVPTVIVTGSTGEYGALTDGRACAGITPAKPSPKKKLRQNSTLSKTN